MSVSTEVDDMMIGLNDSDVTSSLAPPSPTPPSDLIVPQTASRPIDTSPAAAHGEAPAAPAVSL